MTAVAAPPTDRRGFLRLVALGIGGSLVVSMLSIPDVGEVEVGTHATAKHGWDAIRARTAILEMPTEFFFRPPCRDGRYRFWRLLRPGEWAIWVLEPVAGAIGHYREVTAFMCHLQEYVKKISDDCGNDDWKGHSYAHTGGHHGRREVA